MDDRFATACRTFGIKDFSDVLGLVIDGLAKQGLQKTSLCDLIHLSEILVHNAPEGRPTLRRFIITRSLTSFVGTLRTTQEHVRCALSIFVNCPQYTIESELLQHGVSFVAKYFNDRVSHCARCSILATVSFIGLITIDCWFSK